MVRILGTFLLLKILNQPIHYRLREHLSDFTQFLMEIVYTFYLEISHIDKIFAITSKLFQIKMEPFFD